MHTSHSHSSGKIHQPSKTPTTEPTPAAASSERERERERDRDRDRDRESGRGQSNVPPPVRQRASTSGSAAGGQLKARVPPPVPPRGSPRRKDTQDTSRAHSTTPGRAPYDTNPSSSTAASVSASSSNQLQLPSETMPRFGERRSPSNVQDWLELHDLFDVSDSPPHPSPAVATTAPASRRRESLQSAYSVVRSESSHRQQPPRLLNHVDIFQRQNSFMARSDRSSVGSIVRSFPPIRAESYRTARTSVSALSSHCSPRRMQQQQKRHEKRNRYLHYADLALGDDGCDSGQEDNLLQSVSAFLEVKRELEGVYNRRRPLPTLQVEQELPGEQQQELLLCDPVAMSQRRPRRGKRRAPKAAPSTIPESTDTLSNAATQHDSLDLRRNSCV